MRVLPSMVLAMMAMGSAQPTAFLTKLTAFDLPGPGGKRSDYLDEKIRALKAIRKTLVALSKRCDGCGPLDACPILDSFDLDRCDVVQKRPKHATGRLHHAHHREHRTNRYGKAH